MTSKTKATKTRASTPPLPRNHPALATLRGDDGMPAGFCRQCGSPLVKLTDRTSAGCTESEVTGETDGFCPANGKYASHEEWRRLISRHGVLPDHSPQQWKHIPMSEYELIVYARLAESMRMIAELARQFGLVA